MGYSEANPGKKTMSDKLLFKFNIYLNNSSEVLSNSRLVLVYNILSEMESGYSHADIRTDFLCDDSSSFWLPHIEETIHQCLPAPYEHIGLEEDSNSWTNYLIYLAQNKIRQDVAKII